MIKDILENGKQFHVKQKESYSFDEVMSIVEQHKGFVISVGETKINDKITSLEGELSTVISDKDELANSIKEYKTKETEITNQLDDLKKELAPFKDAKIEEQATEYLKGLVLEGAELDAFKQIKDKVKEINFEKGEDKTTKLQPILDELFTTKPYLKIAIPQKEVISEDKNLLTTTKKGAKQEDQPSTNVAVGGITV